MGGDAARLIQSMLLPHFDLLAARHQDCELAAWCAFYRSDYQACLHCLQRCEQTHSDPPAIPRYFNDLHSACLCYLQPAAAANSLSRCWDLFAGAQRLALITAICRPPFLQRVAVDASFLLRHTLQTLLSYAFADAALSLLLSLPSPALCGSELLACAVEQWLVDQWARVPTVSTQDDSTACEEQLLEAVRLLLQRQLIEPSRLHAFCLRSVPHIFTIDSIIATLPLCDASSQSVSSAMTSLSQNTLPTILQENQRTLSLLALSPYHHHTFSFEGGTLYLSLLHLRLLDPSSALFRQCTVACFLQAWLDRNTSLLTAVLRLLQHPSSFPSFQHALPAVAQIVTAESVRVVMVRASSPTEEELFTHLFHRLMLHSLHLFMQPFTTTNDTNSCFQQQCALLRDWQKELQRVVEQSTTVLRSRDVETIRLLLGAVKEGSIDPFTASVMELWRFVNGEVIVEECLQSIMTSEEVMVCELRENAVVWRKEKVLLRIEKNRDCGLTVQHEGDGCCADFPGDAPVHPMLLDSSSGIQAKVDCLCASPSVFGAFLGRSSREGVCLSRVDMTKETVTEYGLHES